MNLLSKPNRLGVTYPHENAERIALRARDLFGMILKSTIDEPTIDGRPVLVTLRQILPEGRGIKTSHSPAEAFEHLEWPEGSSSDGQRVTQVDVPIPKRRDLPTSASRLRVNLYSRSDQPGVHGFDFTAYNPPFDDDESDRRLHFRDDDVRHQILIRNCASYSLNGPEGPTVGYGIRTALQLESDTRLDTRTVVAVESATLEATQAASVLPELTHQEEQILDLGAHALVYYQLRQDLRIMTALAGEDPTHPMGAY